MKSKYMSRKFILAIAWCILAVVAMALGKDDLVYLSVLPSISFILGESIVDKASSVKRSLDVTKYEDHKIDHVTVTDNKTEE